MYALSALLGHCGKTAIDLQQLVTSVVFSIKKIHQYQNSACPPHTVEHFVAGLRHSQSHLASSPPWETPRTSSLLLLQISRFTRYISESAKDNKGIQLNPSAILSVDLS